MSWARFRYFFFFFFCQIPQPLLGTLTSLPKQNTLQMISLREEGSSYKLFFLYFLLLFFVKALVVLRPSWRWLPTPHPLSYLCTLFFLFPLFLLRFISHQQQQKTKKNKKKTYNMVQQRSLSCLLSLPLPSLLVISKRFQQFQVFFLFCQKKKAPAHRPAIPFQYLPSVFSPLFFRQCLRPRSVGTINFTFPPLSFVSS